MEFAVLALVYALADRFAGGGWPALDAKLPGRGAFWGAVLASGVSAFTTHGMFHDPHRTLQAALLGLSWLAYRTPPWKVIPGGSTTPVGAAEGAATFARHLLAAIAVFPTVIWAGGDVKIALIVMAVYAAIATGLALHYGAWKTKATKTGDTSGDPNPAIELTRGLFFGVAAATILSVQSIAQLLH